jgi:hypothetical protein
MQLLCPPLADPTRIQQHSRAAQCPIDLLVGALSLALSLSRSPTDLLKSAPQYIHVPLATTSTLESALLVGVGKENQTFHEWFGFFFQRLCWRSFFLFPPSSSLHHTHAHHHCPQPSPTRHPSHVHRDSVLPSTMPVICNADKPFQYVPQPEDIRPKDLLFRIRFTNEAFLTYGYVRCMYRYSVLQRCVRQRERQRARVALHIDVQRIRSTQR